MDSKFLKQILNNLEEGIIYTNSTGEIQFINTRGQILTGIQEKSAIGKPLTGKLKLYNQTDNRPLPSGLIKIIFNTKKQYHFKNEFYIVSPSNEEISLNVNLIPLVNENDEVEGLLVVLLDVSHKKRFEEEIQDTLRLHSLGKLSSGIAHDFNNVLTTILGNISLARLTTENEEIIDLLSDAEEGIEQARVMTQQLLTFSQDHSKKEEELDVSDLLLKTVNFTLSGSNVTCNFEIRENLWKIHADRSAISQVIHNIVINGIQSMPIGGKISIFAENYVMPPDNPYNLTEGTYIQLKFIDEGIGIPEDELPYVFDPFFKSFTMGSLGKGMGLTVVQNIVQQHRGEILINSEVDIGTTVTIYFPAIESIKKEIVHEIPLGDEITTGNILIMDDEQVIRKVLGKMLSQLGFHPTASENGEKAIELYRKFKVEGNPFDAVILDLTIKGGMGGLEAQKILMKFDPKIKTIASSGYTTDKIIVNYSDYGFKGVLIKPYKVKELKEVLDNLFS